MTDKFVTEYIADVASIKDNTIRVLSLYNEMKIRLDKHWDILLESITSGNDLQTIGTLAKQYIEAREIYDSLAGEMAELQRRLKHC